MQRRVRLGRAQDRIGRHADRRSSAEDMSDDRGKRRQEQPVDSDDVALAREPDLEMGLFPDHAQGDDGIERKEDVARVQRGPRHEFHPCPAGEQMTVCRLKMLRRRLAVRCLSPQQDGVHERPPCW